MFIGGFIILLGAAVITGAQSRAMFLGGRFTLGFGIAISTTAAPTLVTELAPAHWRGRLGAAYNSECDASYVWYRTLTACAAGQAASSSVPSPQLGSWSVHRL